VRPTRSVVPERLAWAVELLDLQPDDRILEIGGGPGVAAALICPRLRGGRLVGIDRSATATTTASNRNAEHVRAGRAEFRTVAVEDVNPDEYDPFDKVFAVNVNLFWVHDAQAELRLIADLLQPDGRLLLVYEPPDARKATELPAVLTDHLQRAGYRRRKTITRTSGKATLVAVTAQRPVGTRGGDAWRRPR
jgi:cyclopropane fatty-acyl-phospholipid synthase-like methyltransferase